MDKKLIVTMTFLASTMVCQETEAAPLATLQPQDTVATAHSLDSLEAYMERENITVSIDTTFQYKDVKPQRDFNALPYILDSRHRYKGDAFTNKKFSNHAYIEFGAGAARLRKNTPYDLTPMTGLHLYLGKEVSPMSSFRIGLTGGPAFLKTGRDISSNTILWSAGGTIDYLYNLSNYILGYRPDRPLQVSAVMGVGAQYAKLQHEYESPSLLRYANEHAKSFNVHAALQLKFFAGSHSALAVEPFMALGSRGMNLIKNGGKLSSAYGVNLSYIWYFNSYLSDFGGDLKRHYKAGQRLFNNDPSLLGVRRPFFIEYAMGPAMLRKTPLGTGKTLGYAVTADIGWWLSSAIGIRGGINTSNADWKATGDIRHSIAKAGVSFDAILNPFGFRRDYDWDTNFGLNLFAGYEGGKTRSVEHAEEDNVYSGNYMGYRGGIQLWARLTDDLRLKLEPTYTVEEQVWGHDNRVRYDEMSLKLGLQLLLRTPRHRKDYDGFEHDSFFLDGLYFGGGFGWNTSVYRWHYKGVNDDIIKNAMGLVGFNFDSYNGLRLAFEYTTDKILDDTHEVPYEHTFKSSILSADYQFNILNAMAGVNPFRRWNVYLYAGPSFAAGSQSVNAGLNAGGMLTYNISKNFALFYSHTAYLFGSSRYNNSQFMHRHASFINSLNIGVIYNFGRYMRNLVDSTKQNLPLFIDYGLGMGGVTGLPTKGMRALGTQIGAGVGLWFTPFLGARASVQTSKGTGITSHMRYGRDTKKLYNFAGTASGAIDLLVNPLGFNQNHFGWDAPMGVNILLGYQNGFYAVADPYGVAKGKRVWFDGLRLGAQFWLRLADGLRLHIEPVYSHLRNKNMLANSTETRVSNSYREGYHKLDLGESLSMKVGLTVFLRNPSERNIPEEESFLRPNGFVGVGGGWNIPLSKRHYEGGGVKMNGMVFGGYRFNGISALRASYEVMSDGLVENAAYTHDGIDGYGFLDRRLTTGFAAVDYQLDLLSLMTGYRASRQWDVSLYGGVAFAMRLGESTKTADGDKAHVERLPLSPVGLNAGAMVEYNINPKWSLFFNHNIYAFGLWDPDFVFNTESIIHKVTAINSFNLGIIRNF